MQLTDLTKELFDNYPDKIIVDIHEFENKDHETYKHLYEIETSKTSKLTEENNSMVYDIQAREKEIDHLKKEMNILKAQNKALSAEILPTMDNIKTFCSEKIFVSDITTDAEIEEVFDVNKMMDTISENPGVYGKYRPSWFTPIRNELSKSNIQKKNIEESTKTILSNLNFWKKVKKEYKKNPEAAALNYDKTRKENIINLLKSNCSNEEIYLKYFLMSPGLDREYLKTLQGASELNINACVLISLLEQPGNNYNKDIIESFVSKIHKGTEYNLKQELANELIKGDWHISAKINGNKDEFQLVPISVINNLITKINAICDFLDTIRDDGLSSGAPESPSNSNKNENTSYYNNESQYTNEEETPDFVEFDDSQLI